MRRLSARSIGFSAMNESPFDGQWRQLAWLLVARGARVIEYWHWNTLPFGAETFWGGVLPSAATTKAAGAGRITVVGTVPDQDLAAGLVR